MANLPKVVKPAEIISGMPDRRIAVRETGLKTQTDEERFKARMRTTPCYICGKTSWYAMDFSMCTGEAGGVKFHGVECMLSFCCQSCNTFYEIKFERGALGNV